MTDDTTSRQVARRPGRPSGYSTELAAEICEQLVSGLPMAEICKQPSMPAYRTVARWLTEYSEFAAMHVQAREALADKLAEEIVGIADAVKDETDHAKVQAAKLHIDARKWTAARLRPRVWAPTPAGVINVGGETVHVVVTE